jgi:hypothetical protein
MAAKLQVLAAVALVFTASAINDSPAQSAAIAPHSNVVSSAVPKKHGRSLGGCSQGYVSQFARIRVACALVAIYHEIDGGKWHNK